MPKKLKPVILYGDVKELHESIYFHGESEWLCIPLTPSSRKAMIEVMCRAIAEDRTDTNALEVALHALIKLANQDQP